MKGLKTIRTSNWQAMTSFYADKLGMRERDQDDKASFREFSDFGTEIHLQKVKTSSDPEVLGSLELYSSNPSGLASHLEKRGIRVTSRKVGGEIELLFSDPDGHTLTIVKKN